MWIPSAFDKWLKDRRWSELHAIGNSKIVQASVFAPFIGYVIIFNDYAVKFFNFTAFMSTGAKSHTVTNIDFRFNLGMTYLGFVFMGFATIAFQFFCHSITKRYPDPENYLERALDFNTARNFYAMANDIKESYDPHRRKIGAKYLEFWSHVMESSPSGLNIDQNYNENERREMAKMTMRANYELRDKYTNRIGLYVTFLLYIIGFGLLMIPSIGFMKRVTLAIWDSILQ